MVIVGAFLAGSVLAAVHHAEVVAHKVGEPYGSLVLAVAVTIIEVALIVTLMISGGEKTQALARDTVFAAVMITCNGILGISLLVGAIRRRIAVFNPEGTGGALAAVATIATLSLVLPSFTTSRPGPQFSPAQLGLRRRRLAGALPAVRAASRPAGTATTSCPSPPPARSSTRRNTPTRRPPATPTSASVCCWSP